jgi:hypothetical protein
MVAAAGLSGAGRSFRSAGDFVADLPQDALARLGARFHPVKRRYIAPNEATNIAISLMRLARCVNIARGQEYLPRRLGYVLTLLGVLTKRPRKEVIRNARTLPMTLLDAGA